MQYFSVALSSQFYPSNQSLPAGGMRSANAKGEAKKQVALSAGNFQSRWKDVHCNSDNVPARKKEKKMRGGRSCKEKIASNFPTSWKDFAIRVERQQNLFIASENFRIGENQSFVSGVGKKSRIKEEKRDKSKLDRREL